MMQWVGVGRTIALHVDYYQGGGFLGEGGVVRPGVGRCWYLALFDVHSFAACFGNWSLMPGSGVRELSLGASQGTLCPRPRESWKSDDTKRVIDEVK